MHNATEIYADVNSGHAARLDAVSERENLRRLLIGLVAVLICIGIQMVQSASLTSRPSEQDSVFLGKHLSYLALSLICAAIASRLRSEWLRNNARFLFWALATLLVAILLPGIGSRINGAQRWLRAGGHKLCRHF